MTYCNEVCCRYKTNVTNLKASNPKTIENNYTQSSDISAIWHGGMTLTCILSWEQSSVCFLRKKYVMSCRFKMYRWCNTVCTELTRRLTCRVYFATMHTFMGLKNRTYWTCIQQMREWLTQCWACGKINVELSIESRYNPSSY